MAKMRVHELAKELDIKSADIVKALGEKGIDDNNRNRNQGDDSKCLPHRGIVIGCDGI